MSTSTLILVLNLITLTGPTGSRIDINPATITSIREPSAQAEGHFAKGTHCLIITASGKFIAVAEECAVVRDKLGDSAGGSIGSAGKTPCIRVCGEVIQH